MGHAIVSGGARASISVTGIKLGDIAEGSIVKLNENGSPVEFYVAKHDYESALNGNGRTLLVRKNTHSERVWNNSESNIYASSSVDNFLNNDYKALFGPAEQSAMWTTRFYYTPMGGDKTVSTLQRTVFLLSVMELNYDSLGDNDEGAPLPIYSKLVSPDDQWTRSPYIKSSNYAYILNGNGNGLTATRCTAKSGVRPCFTLPSGALFDEKTLILKGVA